MGLGLALGLSISGSGGSTPTPVASPTFQFESDVGVVPSINGATVTSWTDQVSSTVLTSVIGVTYVLSDAVFGGKPSLSMAGGGQLSNAVPTISQPNTIYLVGLNTGNTNYFDGNAARQVIGKTAGNHYFYAGAARVDGAGDSNIHAFAAIYNGASSKLYIDSSAAPVLNNVNVSSNALTGFKLGANSLTGKIAAWWIYSGAHTQTQVAQMFAFLGFKYTQSWS